MISFIAYPDGVSEDKREGEHCPRCSLRLDSSAGSRSSSQTACHRCSSGPACIAYQTVNHTIPPSLHESARADRGIETANSIAVVSGLVTGSIVISWYFFGTSLWVTAGPLLVFLGAIKSGELEKRNKAPIRRSERVATSFTCACHECTIRKTRETAQS